MIKNITYKVCRSPKYRLCTQSALSGIYAPVSHHSYVMYASISFNKIIGHEVYVVIINVYGNCFQIMFIFRRTISGNTNSIVKKCNSIVADNMARPIYTDGCVAIQLVGRVNTGVGPATKPVAVIATDHNIICYIKIFRTGKFGGNCDADFFNATVFYSKTNSTCNFLKSCSKCNISITDSQSFEYMMS